MPNGQSEKLSPQVAAPPPGLLVESPRPSKVRLGSCQRQRRDPARGMHSGWRPMMPVLKPEAAAASTPSRCHPPAASGEPRASESGFPGHTAGGITQGQPARQLAAVATRSRGRGLGGRWAHRQGHGRRLPLSAKPHTRPPLSVRSLAGRAGFSAAARRPWWRLAKSNLPLPSLKVQVQSRPGRWRLPVFTTPPHGV